MEQKERGRKGQENADLRSEKEKHKWQRQKAEKTQQCTLSEFRVDFLQNWEIWIKDDR